MRICPCGGTIVQYELARGDVWKCTSCGRRELMLYSNCQVLEPQDTMKPSVSCVQPKPGNGGSSTRAQQTEGFCVSVPIADDETTSPARAAIEKTGALTGKPARELAGGTQEQGKRGETMEPRPC